MAKADHSRYRVPFDGSFRVARAATSPPKGAPGRKRCRERLARAVEALDELQHRLYADDRWSVLVVFQAMDAAGKDGTIRAVMTGVNPAAVEVHAFKAPSAQELDHDFLWRTAVRLPERGRIGIFNRSYYEEVLVVRVHPELLEGQKLPRRPGLRRLWRERLESIREHERHLARNGVAVVKFWLNVSQEEQRRRFVSRLEDPEKHWKFRPEDAAERVHWNAYMAAYQEALRATSRAWAPWYAIPADDKDYMRMQVAETLVATLRRLNPKYPDVPKAERSELRRLKRALDRGRA
jgi:PPK2 family polyphosphate:nucleotide phosphotransferase